MVVAAPSPKITTLNFVERKSCPACACTKFEKVLQMSLANNDITERIDRWYESRVPQNSFEIDSYVVLECQACSLLYTKYHLDDSGIEELYGHWIKHATFDEAARMRAQPLVRRSVNLIRHLVKPTHGSHLRVLDFGAGLGLWAKEAMSRGEQVCAIELSASRVKHMIEDHGLDASQVLRAHDVDFDFVYLSQVLEHLPDPLSTLREISSRCRNGAMLLVGVPNGSRTRRNLSPAQLNWDEIDPIEHINCFNAKSMSAMMQQAGFRAAMPADAQSLYGAGILLTLWIYSYLTGVPGRFFVKAHARKFLPQKRMSAPGAK